MEERFSVDTEASTGAGGKGDGRSSFGAGIWGGVDTEPPGVPDELATVDPAVASSVVRGESSGFAIRSPPRDWDRLRSPFMTGNRVGDREKLDEP